jgi:hypothetical protein
MIDPDQELREVLADFCEIAESYCWGGPEIAHTLHRARALLGLPLPGEPLP